MTRLDAEVAVGVASLLLGVAILTGWAYLLGRRSRGR